MDGRVAWEADGWTDGRMDALMDGWPLDGRMGQWIDGWMDLTNEWMMGPVKQYLKDTEANFSTKYTVSK